MDGVLLDVARGLASRQRLKPTSHRSGAQSVRGRQGIGFSTEIETSAGPPQSDQQEVARGLASRQRLKRGNSPTATRQPGCRQGIGFSTEIETSLRCWGFEPYEEVARGLASRQRLKLVVIIDGSFLFKSRQGI